MLILIADITYNGGICDLSNYTSSFPNVEPESYVVESQSDFDATFGNCTTIVGYISISPNYTGAFIMKNITNITEGLLTLGMQYLSACNERVVTTTQSPTPFLTSVQANNLVETYLLDFTGVPALESISLPNLSAVGILNVHSSPKMSLNFPKLAFAMEIAIEGGFSR